MFLKILFYFSLGFLGAFFWARLTKKWAGWDKRIGWHIHHSVSGLIAIIISFLIPEYFIGLFSAGIGIIFQHTLEEGRFVFINRWDRKKTS